MNTILMGFFQYMETRLLAMLNICWKQQFWIRLTLKNCLCFEVSKKYNKIKADNRRNIEKSDSRRALDCRFLNPKHSILLFVQTYAFETDW
jgi:hypothetical protein